MTISVPTPSRRLALAAAGLLALLGTPAHAKLACKAMKCPTAAPVEAARAIVERDCPCATQASAKKYKKCAKQALKTAKQEVGIGLTKDCQKDVKAAINNATCGRVGFVPCNKRNKKDTKTTCSVVKTTKCKGSACGAFTSCADACNTAAQTCATTTSTTTTTTPTTAPTTTTTVPAGCCNFSRLSFTTGIGSGNCGTSQHSSGTVILNLACGGLYFGSGLNSVPLPATVPDQGTSLTSVTQCDAGTGTLTLGPLTSAQTGSNQNCTGTGCLFGPPLPIPNASSTPTSTCVLNSISGDASGTGNCGTGESNVALPLNSQIFLNGDILPGVTGIQACPLCSGGTCQGGPNNGAACTPGSSALNESYPTSHDCPPDPGNDIGGLPIPFNLTTGTVSRTATAQGTQPRVYCGFCRDQNAVGTLAFEQPARACATNADCTNTNFPDCEQRNSGAFGGGNGATSRTITITGSPAGGLADGLPHISTLVSIFCIPPTYDPTVDNAGDLPGPGAVALTGDAQLLP